MMKLEELIEKLRETHQYIRQNRTSEKNIFLSSDNFIKIDELINELYATDETFKNLVDDGDLEEICRYVEALKKSMWDRYGTVFNSWNPGLISDIRTRNFNEIYRRFQEKSEYFTNVSFEQHLIKNGFTIKDANSYEARVYVNNYRTWENLLNDFYKDIEQGNFSGLLRTYNQMYPLADADTLLRFHRKHTGETKSQLSVH